MVGFEDVEQMVGYAPTSGSGKLGRADVETAIELERVAIDDFTAELFSDGQGKIALPGSRWTHDGYGRGVW